MAILFPWKQRLGNMSYLSQAPTVRVITQYKVMTRDLIWGPVGLCDPTLLDYSRLGDAGEEF